MKTFIQKEENKNEKWYLVEEWVKVNLADLYYNY